MIASASLSVLSLDQVQASFLAALPRIERHAKVEFRAERCPDKKADLIAEVRAICFKWWRRLLERHKNPMNFVSALATYACRAVKSGRRVCGMLRPSDVLSERARARHGFTVTSLPVSTRTSHGSLNSIGGQRRLDEFEERLQDNTVTPVPEQAMFRIDWPEWLKTRCKRDRHLIREMARGERTKDLANRFQLSEARVSQLRREFMDDWTRFTDDEPHSDAAA